MRNRRVLCIAILVLGMVVMGREGVCFAQAQGEGQFSQDRLDQLVAPIALYPDPLLAQIMMAATYPLEVVEADRWLKKNPGLQGEALQTALENQTWDPSVASLTEFPEVLNMMSENLDWTKDLGDAFLAQQSDVMDAVQRMRAMAYESGNLKSTPEQNVVSQQQVIQIEPANPEVVYVPAYDPTLVYGSSWAYPTTYYPAVMGPPPGYVASNVISFGLGVATGAAVFGSWDWHDHRVYEHHYHDHGGRYDVNVEKKISTGDITVNRGQAWKHSPEHRKGVNYGNESLNKKYGKETYKSGLSKDSVRGYGPGPAKPSTLPTGERKELARKEGQRPPSRGEQRKPAASTRPAPTGGRQDAFSGYDNGKFERQASNRGATSRGVQPSKTSRPSGGAKPSAPAKRGGGSKGGGGSRGGGRGGRR